MRKIEYTALNWDAIYKIHNLLSMVKDCDAGYTSKNNKEMLINVAGINYRITIDKIGVGELTTELVDEIL